MYIKNVLLPHSSHHQQHNHPSQSQATNNQLTIILLQHHRYQTSTFSKPSAKMQFKSIITVLSIALVATALPAENAIEKRTGSVTAKQCNASSGKQVCCNNLSGSSGSGGLLGLGSVNVLSNLLNLQCNGKNQQRLTYYFTNNHTFNRCCQCSQQ